MSRKEQQLPGPYFVKKASIPQGMSKDKPLGDSAFYHSYQNHLKLWIEYVAGKHPMPLVPQPVISWPAS